MRQSVPAGTISAWIGAAAIWVSGEESSACFSDANDVVGDMNRVQGIRLKAVFDPCKSVLICGEAFS
jgi:hypothetical protein